MAGPELRNFRRDIRNAANDSLCFSKTEVDNLECAKLADTREIDPTTPPFAAPKEEILPCNLQNSLHRDPSQHHRAGCSRNI
jgi:hypothetical protein